MEKLCSLWLSIFTVVFMLTLGRFCDGVYQERQVYIVYMGALPEGQYQLFSHHENMLKTVIGPKFVRKYVVRSYTRSFNAFAAYLTKEETKKLSRSDGVVSVFPNRILQPQTTRSWDFMGFSETASRNLTTESNVIVGLIDTGVWPESESFSDKGFGPVPSKWKGACKGGKNFTCNKVFKMRDYMYTKSESLYYSKIIGARRYSFRGEDDSARDIIGHGCHTASIAAGNIVKDTSFYGLAQGTARGAVPSARIAAYKVCQPVIGCYESDIMAAFDDAIADGVDVISISIGGGYAQQLYADSIAIGAFHALERGILTVHAAGNDGLSRIPTPSVAPWMLTVAASSTDRRIINKVVLGNATTIFGASVSVDTFNKNGGEYPLVYGKEAAITQCGDFSARNCASECLDHDKVKGKIVRCDLYAGIKEAHRAGALGALVPAIEDDYSSIVPFPAAALGDMKSVNDYMSSSKTPIANISISEAIRNLDATVVAKFSSRGPNTILPDILKPDLTAPGMEILAAYSPLASITSDPLDKRSAKYSILSGTSMSCPHAAGAAAYVKSFHPDWSPSAIKSALMTTTRQMNSTKYPDTEFSYGAGHIDPVKAANPGLVYETTKDDYIKMVCSLNYELPDLGKIFGTNISCPTGVKMTPKDLNYPSMAARVNSTFNVEFQRTVTNVGLANSTYKATITQNSRLNITVEPDTLSFNSLNEKKSFVVTVSGSGLDLGVESAALIWSHGLYSVRSPIVVY